MTEATQPARGYSWPAAGPENELATKHGAWSERRWRPLAEQLAAEAVVHSPWLARPSFTAAIVAWSTVEAQVRLVDDYLDDHGLLDDAGVPRPATMLADRLRARAITLRGQLGLDPISLAKLLATFHGVPSGEDVLEALMAEGRRIIEARGFDDRSEAAGTALPVAGGDAPAATLSEPEAPVHDPQETIR